MIVLDTSAVVELLLDTERGRAVADRIAVPDETLHAPELLVAEVASVLRKLMLRQQLELATARRSVLELGWLGIEYYPHPPFVDRTFDLAAVMTSYDAMFVVLAEVLGAPLVTCDTKLAGTSGHSARIEVIAA